jgi:hypothetical protein
MNIFLVTSGIHGPYGVFSPKERIEQTIKSAQSIRTRISDSHILLLEGGTTSLSTEEYSELSKYFDEIQDYTSDPIIQFAHKMHREEVISLKGPCEAKLLWNACATLKATQSDRIFKLSGRYYLNDDFDLAKHTEQLGKYVFLEKHPGEKYNKLVPATPYQYKTRLYSFCGSILDKGTSYYKQIFDGIVHNYSNGTFIDIEHMMYKTINPNLIIGINPIGVSGLQAVDGRLVEE